LREHLLIARPRRSLEIGLYFLAGPGPWQSPSPQIIDEPWIPNHHSPELARRHPVLR